VESTRSAASIRLTRAIASSSGSSAMAAIRSRMASMTAPFSGVK